MYHASVQPREFRRRQSQHEAFDGVGVELLQESAGDRGSRGDQRDVLQVQAQRAILRPSG